MLPAPGQGAIGLEVRADDARTRRLLDAIHCRETGFRITAERALLAQLDGSCKTPIAALAELEGGTLLRLRGLIARSEEHTSELQSLMRISYAVFCLHKKNDNDI